VRGAVLEVFDVLDIEIVDPQPMPMYSPSMVAIAFLQLLSGQSPRGTFGWIGVARPSRRLLRSLLRMRMFLDAIKNWTSS